MVDSIGSSASCIFRYYPNYGLEKLVRHHYIIGSATTIIYNVRKCLTLIQLHKKRQTIFNIVNCLPSLRVGVTGFEPATTWSQTRCATGLRYAPNACGKRGQS